MIRLIEALHFRCLQYIRQPLGPFHILVGPNASGKTTFLDVVNFLGRLVNDGLDAALEERTANFQDLVWNRQEGFIELAIEVAIPNLLQSRLPNKTWDTVRYEVKIGPHPGTQVISIRDESGLLKPWKPPAKEPSQLFPKEPSPPETLMSTPKRGTRRVFRKSPSGQDHFYSETQDASGKGWFPTIRLGPKKSILGNLPEDESKSPVATWLKSLLTTGVQTLILNSLLIRKASPPGQSRGFKPDGSNLPWVIADLRTKDPERFTKWIQHLQTALPDIQNIDTVERADDRHRYLIVKYQGGLRIPSWMTSDGTLRLLALTLLAYLPSFHGIYLIEEPENGIHPSAVETVYQSLSSVYDAQILLATHSPVILSLAERNQILCFKKTDNGATDIVSGEDHPALRDWKKETDLGTLLAAGVLG